MATLNLSIGSTVYHGNSSYTIVSALDLERVVARSHTTGNTERFNISELSAQPFDPDKPLDIISKKELLSIPDDDWINAHNKALRFAEILKAPDDERRALINAYAQELDVAEITLYKQLQKFKTTQNPLSLLREARTDKGHGRLDKAVEEIIQEGIDRFYLSNMNIKVTAFYKKLQELAEEKKQDSAKAGKPINTELPHINTIRNRLNDLSESQLAAKRRGSKGKEAHRPIIGNFPELQKPLEVVQIDHTPLDLIIVDDEHREPIGRPTLTLAMDVYSRCVTGFYLSFEKPSALLVGCCLTHSILNKTAWLMDHDIDGEWPVYGVMDTVHSDNGKEFHSKALKRACDRYKINLAWRPVRTPRYGGHIERLFKTLNEEIHQLPGTTKSNIQDKGEYPSEKESTLTLREFETWLTEFIVNIYHKREHSSIGMPPIEKYKRGIMGDGIHPGRGLPPKIDNPLELQIDFLPYQERTVQRYGIQIHGIDYFHDVLRKWIRQPDRYRKNTQKFIVRYDPRDLSNIFFYDPEMEKYFVIPYRDSSHPPISIWELNAIKAKLKEENAVEIDEDAIFEAKRKMTRMVESAKKQTKHIRRNKQKESVRQQDSIPSQSHVFETTHTSDATGYQSDEIDDDIEVEAFEDIEQ